MGGSIQGGAIKVQKGGVGEKLKRRGNRYPSGAIESGFEKEG